MSTSRDTILAKLKAAQQNRGEIEANVPDFTSSVYHPLNPSLVQEFKNNLELIGGKVILCKSNSEIAEQIRLICHEKKLDRLFCTDPELAKITEGIITTNSEEKDFLNLNIDLTSCEFLVAHLGSVLISSAQVSGRRLNVFPETHIVVAHESQIVDYLDNAMAKLQEKYKNRLPSLISNITGPSRTADIEKTLVMGMHGPKTLIVIITVDNL
jgi:L-lactate dehydrogenase complex protein LldG